MTEYFQIATHNKFLFLVVKSFGCQHYKKIDYQVIYGFLGQNGKSYYEIGLTRKKKERKKERGEKGKEWRGKRKREERRRKREGKKEGKGGRRNEKV